MSGPVRPIGEDDLHALVDGRLDQARQAEVAAYLQANPAEEERVAGWTAGSAALRAALDFKVREPVPPDLDLGRLATRRGHLRRWSTQAVAAGMVLATCAGAGGGWLAHRPARPNGVTVVAQEALAAHQLLATDGARSVAWSGGHPAGQMAAPDLSASGYTIQDSQSVVTTEGIGQLFIYADAAGRRISLFIRPMRNRSLTAPMQPVSGAAGWAWATDGLGASLISSAPTPTLRDLAEHVRLTLRL